jgi:hypothetical protein
MTRNQMTGKARVTITFDHAGPGADLAGTIQVFPGQSYTVDLQRGDARATGIDLKVGSWHMFCALDDLVESLIDHVNSASADPDVWQLSDAAQDEE